MCRCVNLRRQVPHAARSDDWTPHGSPCLALTARSCRHGGNNVKGFVHSRVANMMGRMRINVVLVLLVN